MSTSSLDACGQATTPLTQGQRGPLHSQSLFQFVQSVLYGDAETARHVTARKESAGKAEYGKSSTVKYCSSVQQVVKDPKSSHITSSLKSLHWLKIRKEIDYITRYLLLLIFAAIRLSYLYDIISVQPICSICCSDDCVTSARPPSSSYLKVSNRSFHYNASPCL